MTKSPFDDPLEEMIVYGIKNDLFLDAQGRGLLNAWQRGLRDDPVIRALIGGRVKSALRQEAYGTRVPFRLPRLNSGKIILGHGIPSGTPRIPIKALASGTLSVSTTGGGKTTRDNFLIPQLLAAHVRTWIVDQHKRERRHLYGALGSVGLQIVVIRPRDLKFNPLQAE